MAAETGWRAPRWAWPVTLPLAVLGLADSGYLTYAHFTDPKVLACSEKGAINCAKVTTSAQSEIFGHIPVAVTGLVYFFVVLLLMTPWAWRRREPAVRWVRLAALTGGLGMVAYLVYSEAVTIKAICLYCTGVHIITVLLFIAVLAAWLFPPLELEPEAPAVQRGSDRTAATA